MHGRTGFCPGLILISHFSQPPNSRPMNPARLLFFLVNVLFSFSMKGYFVRRSFNILLSSFFQIISISLVSGALIAYSTFILSAGNPFGVSLQNFLPFLYSRLVVEEMCPLVAFITVLGQCCIGTGMDLHECARKGEMEILYIYKVNPVAFYLSPFLFSAILLAAIACSGFIIASFAVIFWMVYLSEPGYFVVNAEKYLGMIQPGTISLIFVKSILFSLIASLTASFYAMGSYTKTGKYNVSMVIVASILFSITVDFAFQLLI